jgi:hypothetical protein
VIGAGALEIDSGVAIDEGFFAYGHGVDERGLGRRPKGMHFGDDARVNASSPEFEAIACEAREDFNVFCFC